VRLERKQVLEPGILQPMRGTAGRIGAV